MIVLKGIRAQEVLDLHFRGKKGQEVETLVNVSDVWEHKRPKNAVMFLDSNKEQIVMRANMVDSIQNGPLPIYTSKPCWHCRNTFDTHPIGCPVRYNPQSTGTDGKRSMEKLAQANFSVEHGNDFFETEGIFCSFPCAKAYIVDQICRTKLGKYRDSLTLLSLLYLKCFGEEADIPVAGTWKSQTEWGGHLTPKEFRDSLGKFSHIETVNTMRPYMYCSGVYIQEKKLKRT